MARFWSQLTPSQRRRVQARLNSSGGQSVGTAEAARTWDAMGLPERDTLIFGAGAPPRPGTPARSTPASDPPEPGTPPA